MRLFTRLLLALPLLLLAFGMTAGCHSTVPSLLLHIEDPTGLAPTQLRVKVSVEELETHNVTRPEVPNGALASPQTLRLFMPDEAIGRRVDLTVEALRDAVVVGEAVTVTVLKAVEDTRLEVALVPTGALEVCDAATCPFGCCDGNVCIEGDTGACGVGGGACGACDATSTDQCVEGACRCGADVPCPAGYQCRDGACAPDGEGQSCSVDEQCNSAPGQCFEAQGTCGENGKCTYAPKASTEACNDGDSCTEGDHCDGSGACVSTPMVCDGPTGQCLVEGSGQCVNGTCRYDPKPSTTGCEDNNDCTQNDRCDGAGSCKGTAVTCNQPPNDKCWEKTGTCEGGDCTYTQKSVGASCGTGDACTALTCNAAGQCVSSPKVTCNAPTNACQKASGTCNPATGACDYEIDVGKACTDTDQCTSNTTCQANGSCGGGTQKVCNSPTNQCHKAVGTCNSSTGACSYAFDTGASCNDGNACTTGEKCTSTGACSGGTQKVCNSPPDQCRKDTGTCNTSTGACSYAIDSGAACNDNNACTTGETCNSSGTCTGGTMRTCSTTNPCKYVDGCNSSTGECILKNRSSGYSCGTETACATYACNGTGTCIATPKNEGLMCPGECGQCRNGVCSDRCGEEGKKCCNNRCIEYHDTCIVQ